MLRIYICDDDEQYLAQVRELLEGFFAGSMKEVAIFKKYGKLEYGDSISRDVIVPSEQLENKDYRK